MYLTRAAKRARFMEDTHCGLVLVLHSGFVPWYDAVKLGVTCKEMHHEWQDSKNRICEPVLTALNRLKNAASVCENCLTVAFPTAEQECRCRTRRVTPLAPFDPRSNDNYTQLSTWEKCKVLSEFTARLVSNFQSYCDFDNPSNPAGIPAEFQFQWVSEEFLFLAQHMPRRLAFMTNIMIANWGQGNLYGGISISRFHEAFAGTGFDPGNVGSTSDFEDALVLGFFPATNDVLAKEVRDSRGLVRGPNQQVWETLGPVLCRKLDFLAPFFNDNGEALLPEDLEPMSNEQYEQMGEWMYWRFE